MTNNFQITITAVDKATAAVRKVNQSLERLTRPVRQMQNSLRALSREAGLDKVGKSLVAVGRSARDVAAKFGSIVAPMMAVIGVGSIAGVVRLAAEWANFGMQLTNTAANIGISVESLQSLRGAAMLSGVSAGALTSGLKSLGNTMEDALYGRNQEALVMMNTLGIHMHRTASGAVDTNRAFRDLANSIAKVKSPQVQGLIARTFGLEEALPLLRKGAAGVAELETRVKHFGAQMTGPQLAAANKFQQSMLNMKLATEGLKIAIADKLFPVLGPLVDKFAEWITANKNLIATKITDFIKKIADWLQKMDWDKAWKDVVKFTDGITSAIDALGGIKAIIYGVATAMSLGLIANVVSLIANLGTLTLVTIPAAITALRGLGAAQATAAGGGVAAAGGAVAGGAATAEGAGVAAGAAGLASRFLPFMRVLRAGMGAATLAMLLHSEDLGAGEEAAMDRARASDKRALGLRNNNPGNLRHWGNAPVVKGFARFNTPEQGIQAMVRNLQSYGSKGYNSIASIINRWAPGSENNTGAYVSDVATQTGLNPNAHLNMNDPRVLSLLTGAIIKHKNGNNPYGHDMINHQVDIVLHGAASGTQVAARSRSPNVSTTGRIGQTLPGVG